MLYFLSRRWAIFAVQVNKEWQLFCMAAKSKLVMSAANFRFVVRSEADSGMKPGVKCMVQCSRLPQPGNELAVNKKRKCCKNISFF